MRAITQQNTASPAGLAPWPRGCLLSAGKACEEAGQRGCASLLGTASLSPPPTLPWGEHAGTGEEGPAVTGTAGSGDLEKQRPSERVSPGSCQPPPPPFVGEGALTLPCCGCSGRQGHGAAGQLIRPAVRPSSRTPPEAGPRRLRGLRFLCGPGRITARGSPAWVSSGGAVQANVGGLLPPDRGVHAPPNQQHQRPLGTYTPASLPCVDPGLEPEALGWRLYPVS